MILETQLFVFSQVSFSYPFVLISDSPRLHHEGLRGSLRAAGPHLRPGGRHLPGGTRQGVLRRQHRTPHRLSRSLHRESRF